MIAANGEAAKAAPAEGGVALTRKTAAELGTIKAEQALKVSDALVWGRGLRCACGVHVAVCTLHDMVALRRHPRRAAAAVDSDSPPLPPPPPPRSGSRWATSTGACSRPTLNSSTRAACPCRRW